MLKSKILIGFFCIIMLLQVTGIITVTALNLAPDVPTWKGFPGPAFLIIVILSEFQVIRYMKKVINGERTLRKWTPFIISILEATVPTLVIFYAGIIVEGSPDFTNEHLLNSPPVMVYFVFIILSAFFLDMRVSIYVSLLIAVEYAFLNYFFIYRVDGASTAAIEGFMRAGFFLFAGVASGFVAIKIKESILDSLQSKNILIHELDTKVKERTVEIEQQKEEVEAQRDQIESQRELLEKRNKDITDSIIYARRIQTAILPSHDLFDRYLTDYFVLFKPKDIVSGDFYWANEKNGQFYFSAVDCTGHGVPGSLVSMLANTGLENGIRENGITTGAELLTFLNEEIVHSLNKNVDTNVKDGMDLALIRFDQVNRIVEFTGANNPMVVVRNGELEVIKGNRQPVGNPALKEPFTSHLWKAEKGDRFYIFSDGYPDQFGGPDNKKFMVKVFKRLLLEIHSLPMNEQQAILEERLEEWMGSHHQTDDVCVIGFSVD